MVNNLLEGLEYRWLLVAKTQCSQKLKVIVDVDKGLSAQFDIHYTRSKIAQASVCFIGKKSEFTDGLFHWLLFDLEKIVKRRGRYRAIRLSTAYVDKTIAGDFLLTN